MKRNTTLTIASAFLLAATLLAFRPDTSVTTSEPSHEAPAAQRPHRFHSARPTVPREVGQRVARPAADVLPTDPAPAATFDKAGLVRLQCEIHDHMKAVILVVDSRYFTTTDAAGKFTLSGLPPGTYTVHAQFDEKAKWSTSVTISPGKTTAADFASNPSVP